MLPEVAVMRVVPAATGVAKPVLTMVATAGLDDFQVTALVRSTVPPPLTVPIAVNCTVAPPAVVDGLVGVTAIETRLATVTVTVVVELTVPEAAVMVAVPGTTPVTRPVLLIVATLEFEVDQVTVDVIGPVLPSLKVPVATICCVVPAAIEGVDGVMVIPVSTGSTKNPLQPATISKTTVAKVTNSKLDRDRP
jgi:hypothetical protein